METKIFLIVSFVIIFDSIFTYQISKKLLKEGAEKTIVLLRDGAKYQGPININNLLLYLAILQWTFPILKDSLSVKSMRLLTDIKKLLIILIPLLIIRFVLKGINLIIYGLSRLFDCIIE